MQQVVVIAKKAGALALASPQFDRTEESVIEGTAVVLGMGNRELPAGQTFALTVSGLPHHSSAPRNITLVLAAIIVVVGFWAATRSTESGDRAADRKRLIARREKLFQDLVRLEQDRRRGRVAEPRYSARREELLAALENVYGALDEDDAGPEPASRAGVAA
jgi:hypothetical protein